jgi:hypothetical protein
MWCLSTPRRHKPARLIQSLDRSSSRVLSWITARRNAPPMPKAIDRISGRARLEGASLKFSLDLLAVCHGTKRDVVSPTPDLSEV